MPAIDLDKIHQDAAQPVVPELQIPDKKSLKTFVPALQNAQ